MIYFTSDTHFDHKNVLSYSSRNFHDVNEMNEKIIANWNSIVRSEDTVYHLGDFAFSNPQKFIDRLVGNIIFVKGSHDKSIDAPYMRIIYPDGLKDEYGNKRSITLCHYSMRSWDKSHYASWHLYGHCVDKDTEILTKNGFKKYSEIRVGDLALSLNIENNKLEYSPIENVYIYSNNGKMFEFKNKSASLLFTEGHNIIGISSYKDKIYFEKAKESFERSYLKIPVARISDGITFDKGKEFFVLLGLIISEGHFCHSEKDGGNGIIIHQKECRKSFIENVLFDCKADFKIHNKIKGMIAFYITAKWVKENIYGWLTEKNISEKLMNIRGDQFKSFLSGLIYGDGYVPYPQTNKEDFCTDLIKKGLFGRCCVYYSSNKDLIDRLSHLSTLNGFSTKFNWHKSGFKDGCYYLIISDRQNVEFRKNKHNRNIVNYDGIVWCVTTKNKNFVARRDGFTFITGNSHGMLEPYGLSFDVGVDRWNFFPVSLEQVDKEMSKLKPIVDFRKT